MDKVVWALILISILFIITYNPQSGRIEQLTSVVSQPQAQQKTCCDSQEYRASNGAQCESTYYQGLQFGNQNLGCPRKLPSSDNGAIIATNV
jgi:hypothetical protein